MEELQPVTPTWTIVLGNVGFWGGVILGIYLKIGFWKTIGIAMVGAFSFASMGNVIDKIQANPL